MANEFYDHGAVPATGSSLSSATIRAEFDAIEAGFDKLPTLAGQAGKLVKVNAGATGLDTTDAPDINGGTIDGATIGATTRAAGNFTTLDASGNVVLGDASTDTVTINGTVQPGVVVSGSSTGDALRITQTGTGNALVVEDESSPDSTPVVVTSGGILVAGATAPSQPVSSGALIQTNGTGNGGATIGAFQWSSGATSALGGQLALVRSKGTSVGAQAAVVSGDIIGSVLAEASDGTNFVRAAAIQAVVDGTPTTGSMPGRLVFSTTPSGSSTPVEAMRIDSYGKITIGGTPAAGVNVYARKDITGATTAYGIAHNATVRSDVTGSALLFNSTYSTEAAGFNLANLTHYTAGQGAIGAGSSITNQYGFSVASTLTGATNNYGFYSNIAAATGRWNFYANGTAANYFAGNVGIGSSAASNKLDVRNGQALFTRSSLGSNIAAPADAELSLLSNVATSSAGTQQITFHSDRADRWSAIGHYRDTLSGRIGLSFFTSNDEAAPVERLRLTHTGGLQINRTDVTAPAASDGNVFSGTYTPTLTNTTNVSSSTAYQGQYMRVGNTVNVSLHVSITPTATGNVALTVSLPIASNFTQASGRDGSGVFFDLSGGQIARGWADAVTDTLQISFNATATAAREWSGTFQYVVK